MTCPTVLPSINGIAYSSNLSTINGIGYSEEAAMAGRPAVGPMVNVRLPKELIEGLDQMASSHGLTRAATIRIILDDVVQGHRTKHLINRLMAEAERWWDASTSTFRKNFNEDSRKREGRTK